MVVFTPKSMLRNRKAISEPDQLTGDSRFHPVLGDGEVAPRSVERVLLCSGKIAWDLRAERAKRSDERTAIATVEQLSPLPTEQILGELERFPSLQEVRWVQDEPQNMGPWPFMVMNLLPELGDRRISSVTRRASASPAAGSPKLHQHEHDMLMNEAFA